MKGEQDGGQLNKSKCSRFASSVNERRGNPSPGECNLT